MRGSEGNHVLMLIDGMEASDPYQGEFDFATLIADDVERIEVLRGQQSALHGSDAIGGVTHSLTASGREAPGSRARIEYGSFNTFDGALRFAGFNGGFDYAFNAGYQKTGGVPNSRFGTRDLGAGFGALSARVGLEVSDDFRLKGVGRLSKTEADSNPTSLWPPAACPCGRTSLNSMRDLIVGLNLTSTIAGPNAFRSTVRLEPIRHGASGQNRWQDRTKSGSWEATRKFRRD